MMNMPAFYEQPRHNPVNEALRRCRPHFVAAALFSAVSNILYLTPSLYMMQIYNRVVPTGGMATLFAVSVIATAALLSLTGLEWVRARVLVRASAQIDADLGEPVLRAALLRRQLDRTQRAEAIRALDALRQGVASPALIGLLDAPWFPIYVVASFLLHPALGLLTLASALLLFAIAWLNERALRDKVRTGSQLVVAAGAKQMHSTMYATEVRGLGLASGLVRLHLNDRAEASSVSVQSSFTAANHGNLVKFVRLFLQSAALAVGAILATKGAISAGSIFAASLLLSRALAPVEQIVGAWRPILAARAAYASLSTLLSEEPSRAYTVLPSPTGLIQAENVVVATPDGARVAIADVTFQIAPGEVVGIAGASGSGKSSLLRAMTGAEPLARGVVRFDQASSLDWNPEQLAQHVGYLPQSFVLFTGTVKQNIARFRTATDMGGAAIDAAVVEAAQAALAHDMILRLPQGYDTLVSTGGHGLSAGQAQRIAIARALFGWPRIVLLDEPTAHLDAEAQHAFLKTLGRLREGRHTVIFASHSNDILAAVDKLMILKDGRLQGFAPPGEGVRVSQRPATPQSYRKIA